MPARINHNPQLKQVHRNLNLHFDRAAQQVEQLASGRRVNRASDDPASLALADGIRSEIRAIAEGGRNIQQSIHMLQVTDGAMSNINDMILRMQNLAVEAASSNYTDTDRMNINAEFQALKGEIDRIAESTTFNGISLLDEEDIFAIQAGPSATSNDVSRIAIGDMRASGPTLNLAGSSVNTLADAQEVLGKLQNAHDKLIAERNHIAAFQNRLELSLDTSATIVEKMTGSESDVRDVDMARTISNLSRSQILSQTAASLALEVDVDVKRIFALLQQQ